MSDDLKIISAANRYAAAQAEIRARVTARATLNVGHIVSIGALSTIYFTLLAKVNGECHKDSWCASAQSCLPFFPCVIALVSTYFACLYSHNDTVLGYLTFYNKRLEDESSLNGSGWFAGPWMKKGLAARSWAHAALIILAWASCGLVVITGLSNWTSISVWSLAICLSLSLLNTFIFMRVAHLRDALTKRFVYLEGNSTSEMATIQIDPKKHTFWDHLFFLL